MRSEREKMYPEGMPFEHRKYSICKLCGDDIDLTGETMKCHLDGHNKVFTNKTPRLNYYFTRQEYIGIFSQ